MPASNRSDRTTQDLQSLARAEESLNLAIVLDLTLLFRGRRCSGLEYFLFWNSAQRSGRRTRGKRIGAGKVGVRKVGEEIQVHQVQSEPDNGHDSGPDKEK